MSGKTEIAWTDRVWNPTTGCSRVSAGCDHCYAFQLHDQRHVAWKRGSMPNAAPQYHRPFSEMQLLPQRLGDPFRWAEPSRVFVNSMSDLFHDDVPDEFIDAVFVTMGLTPWHTYQILTKRPERMLAYMTAPIEGPWAGRAFLDDGPMPAVRWRFDDRLIKTLQSDHRPPAQILNRSAAWWEALGDYDGLVPFWPLPNVWLGVSAEDQATADERIPLLLQTPAAIRFVSAEPLLGPIRLAGSCCSCKDKSGAFQRYGVLMLPYHQPECPISRTYDATGRLLPLDWIIIGGESGPHYREMDEQWARDIVAECQHAHVPAFMKQLGGRRSGGALSELPEVLRVREFPA